MSLTNNLLKILFSAVVIVITVGCSKQTKQGREMADGIAMLRRGMTNSEVTSLLGSPTSTFKTQNEAKAGMVSVLANVSVNWTALEVADFKSQSFDKDLTGQPSEFWIYDLPNECYFGLQMKGGHLVNLGTFLANSQRSEYKALYPKKKEEGQAP